MVALSVMRPKDADRIANSVDPDQTAPQGAVRSGSTLFAQTYVGKLRIIIISHQILMRIVPVIIRIVNLYETK